ncbi:MAG: hypothetical protein GF320_17040 [Armatimonadia bacterium]|nr:hypothetical protein [Armatimonadia bacterium]
MARLNIHQFEDFISTAQGNVGELYREIEEVQEALNDARERTRLERQDLVERARRMLKDKRGSLEPGFVSDWDQRVDTEHKSLEAESKVLRELIEEEQGKADEMLGEAEEIRDKLRRLNPELDSREEALKADLGRLNQEAERLDNEIARLAKWFGLLFRKKAIKEKGEQLRQVDKKIDAVEKALESVRSQWESTFQKATEDEESLEAEWQDTQERVARLRQDLVKIESDMEAESERRALFNMVKGAEEPPPTGDAEMDALLAEIDRLSDDVLDEQENALQAGSEMLGMMSGLGEGLNGFRESVASVRQEQDAHSELPTLHVEVPDTVVSFHGYWDQLSEYIVNERQMAAHPAAFCKALRQVIDAQLTGDSIERMFTEMGDALSSATDRWNA